MNIIDRRQQLREQAHAKIATCKMKIRERAASSGWTEVPCTIGEDWGIEFRRVEGGPVVRVKFNLKHDYLGHTNGLISATVECGIYDRPVTYQETKPLGNVNVDKIVARIGRNLSVLERQQERADKDQDRARRLEQTRRRLLLNAPPSLAEEGDGVVLAHDHDGKFKLVLDGLSEQDVLSAFGCLASFTRSPS